MSGLGELDRPGTPTGPGASGADEDPVGFGPAESPEAAIPEGGVPAEAAVRLEAPVPSVPVERRRTPVRPRAGADPVKALMHRHRELCERAVDPLEIAAGLEAHGVTDRTAARFRHRDVFSLAEEMYARVPRDSDTPARTAIPDAPRVRADWAVLALLPGALCAAGVAGIRLTDGQARLAVVAVTILAVAVGLRVALSRGPLRIADRAPRPTAFWAYGLIAYAVLGDAVLRALLAPGPDILPTRLPDGPWPPDTSGLLALALSCAPAAACAHLFATRARRRLAASRGLAEYATSVQPLLLGAFALYLAALTALLALCAAVLGETAAYPRFLALGALLLLARLLSARRFTHAPAAVLAVVTAAEAVALASAFAARFPGCGFLATPVESLVTAWGPGAVPALACGLGALTLLIHSSRTLTRASAHAAPDTPC
ncbi:hypothetical protein [Streptomyces sp. NPDC048002]|uniref:hypothetical protein n=1 Tax=Streptomyces sp. NPDC048002 TaxID=3154344 RepID=UPI0033E5EDF5